MNIQSSSVHQYLGAFVLGKRPTEEDILLLMLLFHTHQIRFSRCILADQPKATELAAITRRHAAEVAAASWPDLFDSSHKNPVYWYERSMQSVPFEFAEDVPADVAALIDRLKLRLLSHPDVAEVKPEGW